MSDTSSALAPLRLPFGTRLWFAWVCFFRVLFDGLFAARAFAVREAMPAAPKALAEKPRETKETAPTTTDAALQLLALLQREGRLVDFLEQEITAFPDAEIGAAARAVHEGCRRALRAHATLAPVRGEEEGARVELAEGFSPAEIKLSGDVRGAAPYKGTLRHKGWRVRELRLPTAVKGHDATIVAPAEVEL